MKKHDIKLYEGDTDKYLAGSGELYVPPSGSVIDDYVRNASYLEERLIQMEDATDQIEVQKNDLEQYRFILQS